MDKYMTIYKLLLYMDLSGLKEQYIKQRAPLIGPSTANSHGIQWDPTEFLILLQFQWGSVCNSRTAEPRPAAKYHYRSHWAAKQPHGNRNSRAGTFAPWLGQS
jgi:hypothetical protein